ncbi:hypothetical protein P9D34_05950 [Bacillus swezeyi]|uniref:Uncharacterized protein n=1 Tax=Bacillus swezeyi TaxID=1925020 RepID=A0A1R1Q793_9BACI|nr:hypothetical protein [Bacillus swezeyi]MEC1259996.1 hypothetical protein [Bacillus swezeyi]MED2929772.1 hypothetical protein [Bacillus swezeyi]MED2963201.1 hypothetical protein [Bacillus swezeyi]MED2979756.1 hypothetical protein [Bacillus swezeyi]MED3073152.1 hypothetical protein [Bacillus swezeyi]
MNTTEIYVRLKDSRGKGNYRHTYCVYVSDWFPKNYLKTKHQQTANVIKDNLEKKYCEPLEDFELRYIPLTVFHDGELKNQDIIESLIDNYLIAPLEEVKSVYKSTDFLKEEWKEKRRKRKSKFVIRTNRIMLGSRKRRSLENAYEGLVKLSDSIEKARELKEPVLA